jgi:heavy metal translocating P-type ATPase
MADPLLFEEYFEGGEEFYSPFITKETRSWAKGLSLKAALFAALLLLISFILSLNEAYTPLAMAVLVPVYFLTGIPSLIDSIEDILNLSLNIDVLMTLAAFGSVIIGSPIEGALLLVLFSISGAMEEAVTSKAKSSLKELHKLSPTKAWVLDDSGSYIQRSVKDIPAGVKILIKAGEVIPLDGVVLQGASSVNLVHLTGENLPVTKKEGDTVPAGGKNMEGSLVVLVTHTSRDSTLSRIIDLVTQAQDAKPRLQQWFDKLSQHYATGIIFLTLLFALTFPFLLHIPFLGETGSIYRSLAFLIAASPCALIIAIPIAYLSALSASAKKGVLLKGGITLDALAACKIMAFDKTGTLTTGEIKVKSTNAPPRAIEVAYALEINTTHPIAKAIQNFAEKQNLKPYPIKNFKSIPGYGIEAEADGKKVMIGNSDYILPQFKIPPELQKEIETIQNDGDLIAIMQWGEGIYYFRLEDTPRPQVLSTLKSLKKEGLRLLMLTGDHYNAAQKIANDLDIDEFHADLKPEDKLKWISDLAEKSPLAFVGDGVNDAPALARATVGIGMGKGGSRAAIDAADVVLLQDNIDRLDWLFQKAHATQKVVKQNLFIATLAILAAAIPALAGLVPLWLAVVVHEGGTILVGLNGLRLLRK